MSQSNAAQSLHSKILKASEEGSYFRLSMSFSPELDDAFLEGMHIEYPRLQNRKVLYITAISFYAYEELKGLVVAVEAFTRLDDYWAVVIKCPEDPQIRTSLYTLGYSYEPKLDVYEKLLKPRTNVELRDPKTLNTEFESDI